MSKFKTIMESWRGFKSVLNERTIPEKDYPRTFQELQSAYKEFEGKTLIFFDTETTGLDQTKLYSIITQLGAVKVDGNSLLGEGEIQFKEKFNSKIELTEEAIKKIKKQEANWFFTMKKFKEKQEEKKIVHDEKQLKLPPEKRTEYVEEPPPKSILGALTMTGYKDLEELKKDLAIDVINSVMEDEEHLTSTDNVYRKINEVLKEFAEFCSPVGQNILIAQNAQFDVRYVNVAFRRAGLEVPQDFVVDSAEIFRKYLVPVLKVLKIKKENGEQLSQQEQEIIKILSTKTGGLTVSLGPLRKAFGVPDEGWHDALSDCIMLAKTMKAVNNYLLRYPEITNDISYISTEGPDTQKEAEIVDKINTMNARIAELESQGIEGDFPKDEPSGRGFFDEKTGYKKEDSPEYAEYAALKAERSKLLADLRKAKAELEDLKDPIAAEKRKAQRRAQDAARRASNKPTTIAESKIRIKIKR